MYHKDTIAAIATPAGSGGIGIIRISGPGALGLVAQIFRSRSFTPGGAGSHRLYYGVLYDPADGSDLDEALVSYMRQGRSYTGEDVVEINCHGGPVLMDTVLRLITSRGARLAEPGEFTRRAFLNGRLDLTRAEAVIDVIDATSELGLKIASRQLTGRLELRVNQLRGAILDATAVVEAAIDFPEDDVLADEPGLAELVRLQAEAAGELAGTFGEGCRYKNGVLTVIAGKPNAGKSSILNALVGDDRALVTPVPGTTRDIVEDSITLNGIRVRLLDTAGLHRGADPVELLGIQRAREKIRQADIVVAVLDASRPLDDSDAELAQLAGAGNCVIAANKTDLPRAWAEEQRERLFPGCGSVCLSALTGSGIRELKGALARLIGSREAISPSEIFIASARHRGALEQTRDALGAALSGLRRQLPPELVAADLHAALESLGEITGATAPDDILDAIFSRFCIGK